MNIRHVSYLADIRMFFNDNSFHVRGYVRHARCAGGESRLVRIKRVQVGEASSERQWDHTRTNKTSLSSFNPFPRATASGNAGAYLRFTNYELRFENNARYARFGGVKCSMGELESKRYGVTLDVLLLSTHPHSRKLRFTFTPQKRT